MTELDATRWADLYRGSEITPLRESFLTDDNGKVSPAGTSHYSCGARSWACQIVSQNLTHRVNACVVQARLGSHSSHGWCPLPHSGEPACWRDWDQGPPNCPTYPPPYLTQHRASQGRMGANKQDDMWEESQIRRQERDLPKCNQATFTLCISTLSAARDVL